MKNSGSMHIFYTFIFLSFNPFILLVSFAVLQTVFNIYLFLQNKRKKQKKSTSFFLLLDNCQFLLNVKAICPFIDISCSFTGQYMVRKKRIHRQCKDFILLVVLYNRMEMYFLPQSNFDLPSSFAQIIIYYILSLLI